MPQLSYGPGRTEQNRTASHLKPLARCGSIGHTVNGRMSCAHCADAYSLHLFIYNDNRTRLHNEEQTVHLAIRTQTKARRIPRHLVPHFHILHFQVLTFGFSFSGLVFSGLDIWSFMSCIFLSRYLVPHFQVLHFQVLTFGPSFSGLDIWSFRSCIFVS